MAVGGFLLLIPNQRANVDRIPTDCCDSGGARGANSVNFVGDSKLFAMVIPLELRTCGMYPAR